jgi:hypothetical protein
MDLCGKIVTSPALGLSGFTRSCWNPTNAPLPTGLPWSWRSPRNTWSPSMNSTAAVGLSWLIATPSCGRPTQYRVGGRLGVGGSEIVLRLCELPPSKTDTWKALFEKSSAGRSRRDQEPPIAKSWIVPTSPNWLPVRSRRLPESRQIVEAARSR